MIAEIIFCVLLGCLLGAFAGAIPGVHTNTLALLAVSFAAGGGLPVVLMVVSMSVVNSFVSFVPSIALGAPSEDCFISILPGHRFLLKGMGLYAIRLTVLGGLFAAIASVVMLPLFAMFVVKFISIIYALVPAIIICVIALMVLDERGTEQKKWAAIVIALSSALGLAALRGGFGMNAIFPLVTGFFGTSGLIYSINQREEVGEQELGACEYPKREVLSGGALSLVAGAIVSLLPSIGPDQAAFILRKIIGKITSVQYLVIIGGVSTANAIFGFFVLYLTGKARTGTAVAVEQIITLTQRDLLFIIATVLFSAGVAVFATEICAKFFLARLGKIPYRAMNLGVLAFLVLLVALLGGGTGLLLLSASTGIGLVTLSSGIKRTTGMAFLMAPTLAFYLGL
ncbi:MAG: tripartite tricarboxylate transporter permease [Candidatus Diapherotrites archaeon]